MATGPSPPKGFTLWEGAIEPLQEKPIEDYSSKELPPGFEKVSIKLENYRPSSNVIDTRRDSEAMALGQMLVDSNPNLFGTTTNRAIKGDKEPPPKPTIRSRRK